MNFRLTNQPPLKKLKTPKDKLEYRCSQSIQNQTKEGHTPSTTFVEFDDSES